MQGRRKGRKRIIKLIKDQEQLAQDKLHEISCLSDDKFVDQSHMLSIQHKAEEKVQANIKMNKEIKNIIDKYKNGSSKVKTEKSVYSQKYRRPSHKTASIFIANKLESNQVFVGIKPKNNPDPKVSEINFLVFQKQKNKTLSSLANSQSKSIPVRKLSTQLYDKLDFCIFGEKKGQKRSQLSIGKIGDRRRQKLEDLRSRIRTELFFNHNDKCKTIGHKPAKFQ